MDSDRAPDDREPRFDPFRRERIERPASGPWDARRAPLGRPPRWVDLTNGDNGVNLKVRPMPFGIDLASPSAFYWATFLVFLAAIGSMHLFVRSPFGASLRGTRDQPRRMNALGFNVWLIRFLAFLFSGLWCAIGGLLYIYYNQFVSPQALHLTTSAEALLMVIAGGTGTLFGPVVGAALVIILKNVVSAYITRWLILLGVIFVAIVLFMPEGLVPGLTRWVLSLRRRSRAGKTAIVPTIAEDRVP